jgi:large subunit ribosomal protein L24
MPAVAARPRVKKGDTVEVLAGKDRGKRGRVVRVWPDRAKILVEGVNQVKRHEKLRPGRGRAGTEGGIITKEMPVHASNVALVCGSCDRPSRVKVVVEDDGSKSRTCHRCGGVL